jgi:hypothetical protein
MIMVMMMKSSKVRIWMIMNCERKRRTPAQWQSGLWRGSAAVRLLGLRVRIPPEDGRSVSCELRVLSGRGIRSNRSYVQRNPTEYGTLERDRKTSQGRSWPNMGSRDILGGGRQKERNTMLQ